MARYDHTWASLMVQTGKNLPAMWENWVQSLGWEDPLDLSHQDFKSTINNMFKEL